MRVGNRSQSAKRASRAAPESVGVNLLGSQPDAAGTATRLAARRLRQAGVPLLPVLRKAGLSEFEVETRDARIGVASQIAFLRLVAGALGEPLLGFKVACDCELRETGLLFYV